MTAPIIAERKKIVGLIGGIGAGKSTVAQRLAERGALVVDADKTGHEVLRDPVVKEKLIQLFGNEILGGDGQIDRTRLGGIVFSADEKRKLLEGVVHPQMAVRFREKISFALADPKTPLVVLDAAILLEVGWDAICDEILFVDVPRPVRVERLSKTRGWSEEELGRREAAQWPIDQKRAKASMVIDNAGSPEDCHRQVDSIFDRLTDASSQ